MFGKKQFAMLAFVMLSGLVFADDSQIVLKLGEICGNVKAIVPVVALLMFIVAGAVYAAGQIMGAETRARANVWATAMLVGGIIGLILAASATYFVQMFSAFSLGGEGTYGEGVTVTC
ncbi:hypothetical protein HY992_02000 [Candidatus Micrarchaeota archaeon]|nr:hypothetical protein [Candidatus Micrarchaeota archaeon]